jgi:molecular chaperone HscB
MEMLEQREALSSARQARDLAAVHRLARAIRARSDQAERDLSIEFARGSSQSLLPKLGELRFFRRFLDEVSAIEDELAA